MNELVVPGGTFTQSLIYQMQDKIAAGPQVECQYQHHFAHGVYARVMIIPADTFAVGECHSTEHLTMLIKGSAAVTLDDGSVMEVEAPFISTTPAGKKKMVHTRTECWFVNVHPDPENKKDVEEVKSRVIIPEAVHRLSVKQHEQLEGACQ